MEEIRMVDLKRQYEKIKPEVDSAISEVIESAAFINGPAVKQFAQNLSGYLDGAHVIPCGNGTDALQVALMALDLEPGDEVITSTFTFIATAEVIALLGLKPVLVDVDPHTFNMDLDATREAITSRTRVIIPVHLFGQCVPMDPLQKLAARHNLAIVEDTCQAIGSVARVAGGGEMKAGTIGQMGCMSFFPSKNLGAFGDGGAIFTRDDTLAKKLGAIVNHGSFKKYYHDYVGVNSRLDAMQAAILDVKLRHLDQYIQARRQAAQRYDSMLQGHPDLQIPVRDPGSTHVFHQYTLILNPSVNRNIMQQSLKAKGVPSMIYYPVPLHMQKAYMDEKAHPPGKLPVSEDLAQRVISLPMHTELDEKQQEYICENVLDCLEKNK